MDAIFVARRQDDGLFIGAGSIELGLQRELFERLKLRLAELHVGRRGGVAWYPAEVLLVASLHGPADRPVRGPVLCEVLEGCA